jgi:hypothetical protein
LVAVFSGQKLQVQRAARLAAEAQKEFLDELGIKFPDLLRGDRDVEAEQRPAAEIRGAKDERLVHRQDDVAVAGEAPLVA